MIKVIFSYLLLFYPFSLLAEIPPDEPLFLHRIYYYGKSASLPSVVNSDLANPSKDRMKGKIYFRDPLPPNNEQILEKIRRYIEAQKAEAPKKIENMISLEPLLIKAKTLQPRTGFEQELDFFIPNEELALPTIEFLHQTNPQEEFSNSNE